MCMQSFVALCLKKALGIFRELITPTTTRVVVWDPPSGSKKDPLVATTWNQSPFDVRFLPTVITFAA